MPALRAASMSLTRENIRRAEAVAAFVWKLGYAALCPHMNSAFFDGLVPDRNFLKGSLRMLEMCDGVILVDGWENSQGTKEEIFRAGELHIPVFDGTEELFDYEW